VAKWRNFAIFGLVAAAIAGVLAGCSLYAPPFAFNNVYDPNRDTASTIAVRTITVDGNVGDWGDNLPMSIDPQGDWDSPLGSGQAIDISAVYLAKDSAYLYWRVDLWDGPASNASSYGLNIWQGIENPTVSLTTRFDNGVVSCDIEYNDGMGQRLYSDPIPDATVAIGGAIEGRVPLSVFTDFVNPIAHLYATYWDSGLSQSSYDDGGQVDLLF
jgi:hypothetical protein